MPLPALTALRPVEIFGHGRTSPLLLEAMDGDGCRHEIVSKVFAPAEGGRRAAIAELICSLLAKELGLNPPAPALVEFPAEFCSIAPAAICDKLSDIPGPHFACNFLPGVSIVAPPRSIPQEKQEEAAAIMSFDTLIQNPDRRVEKPNLLESDDGYHLIDHDMALDCFGQIIIGGIIAPWDSGAIGNPAYKFLDNHLFNHSLRGKDAAFETINEMFRIFDIDLIPVILDQVPESWWEECPIYKEIHDYLLNINSQGDSITNLAKSSIPS